MRSRKHKEVLQICFEAPLYIIRLYLKFLLLRRIFIFSFLKYQDTQKNIRICL